MYCCKITLFPLTAMLWLAIPAETQMNPNVKEPDLDKKEFENNQVKQHETLDISGSNAKLRLAPGSCSYIAGVVEYHPEINGTMDEIFEANLQNYLHFIEEAAEKNVDILVFPEAALEHDASLAYPVPFNHNKTYFKAPCLYPDEYPSVLVKISCAARKHRLYVVINMNEKLDCTKPHEYEQCPGQKVYVFNSNVVFDRHGNIIDRYRKINVWLELRLTPSFDNRLGVFDTDFGVRFGHFICFDIMYRKPALQVQYTENLNNIVFTTRWLNFSPFLTAVQTQETFAYGYDVNLLASCANDITHGNLGSGIYSGKAGRLVSIMPGSDTRRLLTARVPKQPGILCGEQNVSGLMYEKAADKNAVSLLPDPTLQFSASQLINMTLERQEISLSMRDIDCKFCLKLKNWPDFKRRVYKYRAVAYDGVISVIARPTGLRYCALVACRTEEVDSCGHRFQNVHGDNTLNFEVLQVESTVSIPNWNCTASDPNSTYFPSTLQDTLLPLEPDTFNFYSNTDELSKSSDVHIYLKNSHSKLLAFGIYGRDYDKDDTEVSAEFNKWGQSVDNENDNLIDDYRNRYFLNV